MDHQRFDALARIVSSRRVAVTGGVGILAALFGVNPEAAAHNALRRCRTLPTPAERRACRRRARVHNRTHRCTSRPRRIICIELGRCGGVVVDDCGRLINCECSNGLTCLSNGSCASDCPGSGQPGCPQGCRCGQPGGG